MTAWQFDAKQWDVAARDLGSWQEEPTAPRWPLQDNVSISRYMRIIALDLPYYLANIAHSPGFRRFDYLRDKVFAAGFMRGRTTYRSVCFFHLDFESLLIQVYLICSSHSRSDYLWRS